MNAPTAAAASSLAFQLSRQKVQFQAITSALTAREWTLDTEQNRASTHAIFLKSGQGHLALANDQIEFDGPVLLWLPPRSVERLHIKAGGSGYLLSVTDDILANTRSSGAESLALSAISQRMLVTPIEAESLRHDLDHSFKAIEREIARADHGSSTVVTAHVVLIMVSLWRASGVEEIASRSRGTSSSVLQKFRHLVEVHYRDHWPIRKYADALAVSPDRLHAMCVRELERAPLKLVHERVTREATVLLERSMLTIEQISNHLKFKDPSHFNRFFRSNTGFTPGAFRREVTHSAAHTKARQQHYSYADWP